MVYVITIIFSVFFAWLASRVKNKSVIILCSIISVLIPAIVGGLRDRVGTDTMFYGIPDAMNAYVAGSFTEFKSMGQEPGYRLLCYITMHTLGHQNWCLFFYQLISVGCFYIGAYKHRKNAPLPLFMFAFLCMFYVNSFNVIRQTMAASIIFMGINNLEDKNYRRFIGYLIVAIMFHYSSAIVVLFVFIPHVISRQSAYFKYFILGTLIMLLIFLRPIAVAVLNLIRNIDFIPPKYASYTFYIDANEKYGIGEIGSITHLLIRSGVLLMLLFYPKGAKKLLGKYNIEFYKYILVLYMVLNYIVMIYNRMFLYNDMINTIPYVSIPYFVKDKYFKFFLIVMLIISLYFPFYRLYVKSGGGVWYYRSILD